MLTSDPVQRLQHKREGEGVAMDVDISAAAAAALDWTTVLPSSCATAPHPNVTGKVGKVEFPSSYASPLDPEVTGKVVKVLTEEEEDALSTTTTIDYPYSEEEWPSDNSDVEQCKENDYLTEDDEDMEEGKQETYETLKCTPISSDDDSDGDNVSDSNNESPAKSPRPASPVKSLWPPKSVWFSSWKDKEEGPEQLTWINVFAYYNKSKLYGGYGGYGVILRRKDAKPIIASAKFSPVGHSFFEQVLMGINAGITLAHKYAPSVPIRYVRCNSYKIQGLVDYTRCCSDDKCKHHGEICNRCRHYLTNCEGCSMKLWPFLKDIKQLPLSLGGSLGDRNQAAHYVAKMGRDKFRGGKEREKEFEIIPDAFPSALQDILWEDAFGMPSYPFY